MDRLMVAIQFALKVHATQVDKENVPYVVHLFTVMSLIEDTSDWELLAGAVLHDCMEDQGVTAQQLLDLGMTMRVVQMVDNVTKRKGETSAENFFRVCSCRDSVLIKIADSTHNSWISRAKVVTKEVRDRSRYYLKKVEKYKQWLRDN